MRSILKSKRGAEGVPWFVILLIIAVIVLVVIVVIFPGQIKSLFGKTQSFTASDLAAFAQGCNTACTTNGQVTFCASSNLTVSDDEASVLGVTKNAKGQAIVNCELLVAKERIDACPAITCPAFSGSCVAVNKSSSVDIVAGCKALKTQAACENAANKVCSWNAA